MSPASSFFAHSDPTFQCCFEGCGGFRREGSAVSRASSLKVMPILGSSCLPPCRLTSCSRSCGRPKSFRNGARTHFLNVAPPPPMRLKFGSQQHKSSKSIFQITVELALEVILSFLIPGSGSSVRESQAKGRCLCTLLSDGALSSA